MRFTFIYIGICLLLCLLFAMSCKHSGKSEVTTTRWKYSDGFYVGDLLDFGAADGQLKGDTIFRGDSAVARIVEIERRGLSADRVLHIHALHSLEKGRYIGK